MLDQFQDVFKSFNSHDVKYVVLGGIAAILHGVPRTTLDMDILIEPTRDNAERLLRALEEAGLKTARMTTPEQLLAHEITIFRDRVLLDVQTRTPGVRFEDAWARRIIMQHNDQPFHVMHRDDVIASKRAAGREVDLADIRALEAGSG